VLNAVNLICSFPLLCTTVRKNKFDVRPGLHVGSKRTCKCRCKRRSHVRCEHKQAIIRKRSQSLLELSCGGMELMEPVFLLDCLCICVVLVHMSEMQTQGQMKGHICVTVVHTSISWSLRLRYGGSHVYFLAFAFA